MNEDNEKWQTPPRGFLNCEVQEEKRRSAGRRSLCFYLLIATPYGF